MNKIFSDLCHFCDREWLNNIFIASGLFGKDKFSIYDYRGDFGQTEEINYLQMKKGLFQYPSFLIYVDKIVQLICIGELEKNNKINICHISVDECKFSCTTKNGVKKAIFANSSTYDYIQSNGIKIYYFPYAGMESGMFCSFQQITKTEFLCENISGEFNKNSNIKEMSHRDILDLILEDCCDRE